MPIMSDKREVESNSKELFSRQAKALKQSDVSSSQLYFTKHLSFAQASHHSFGSIQHKVNSLQQGTVTHSLYLQNTSSEEQHLLFSLCPRSVPYCCFLFIFSPASTFRSSGHSFGQP